LDPKEEQLFWACRGELEKVKSLCGDPDLNVNWQYKGEYTPLSGACQSGHVEVVEYLLSLKGIDPNKPNNNRTTPFFCGMSECPPGGGFTAVGGSAN